MAEANTEVAMHSIAESNVNFAFDLHKTMDEGNIFYSPISIQVILALVYFGAGGQTAQQIREGLRLSGDDAVIEQGVEATMRDLNESNDIMLDIANRLFLKTGFEVEKGFLRSAAKFMAGVQEVDFAKSEEARKTINDWVEMKTHDKIKNLIPQGVLNGLTRLVLVNAVYFKADWQKQFDKKATAPMRFYSAAGPEEKVDQVDMMQMKSQLRYTMSLDLYSQVLALPYKGNKYTMLIFLPNQVNGLSNLESKLSGSKLQEVLRDMYKREVIVYLPKFKMEYGTVLNGILSKLGMTDMFSKVRANFTGITSETLYVDKVFHKAFVEVNEEGTEAAAATAVVFATVTAVGHGPPPPVIFRADHPFLFYIMEEKTGLVLFAGRYSTPP